MKIFQQKRILLSVALVVALMIFVWSRWKDSDAERTGLSSARVSKHGGPNSVDSRSFYSKSHAEREKQNRRKERLEAQLREADEAERKALEAYNADPPLVVSFSADGRLTNSAIEKLELTQGEIASLGSTLKKVKDRAVEDFSNRLKLVDSGQNDNGGYSYFARARPDRGKEYMDILTNEFEAALGKDRAGKLLKGVVKEDVFGGFGHYDLEIEFLPQEGGGTLVKYNYLNPTSGEVARFGESGLEEFEKKFGYQFTRPIPK